MDISRRAATLCFLVRPGEILLAMKKRGFGVGKWNGVGGKVAPGETILAATIREAEEEIGVVIRTLKPVATLDFFFQGRPEWEQRVHVYLATRWEGEPTETEEMAPYWFPLDAIPYAKMWADDVYWLPRILNGEVVDGRFCFDAEQRLLTWHVEARSSLGGGS